MSLLKVERLRKGYAGQPVLLGVDFEVSSGEVVALLGASGCGKTTLLRLIAGFENAAAGRITIAGEVVEDAGLHIPAERRRIGYVPQEGTLFPHLTVTGNIGFGLSRAERRSGRVEEAIRLTGLEGLAGRYPHQISGGQQQRTALARALAPRPSLLLLDEPFNALDLELRRTVCADVVALLRSARATTLLVTHDPHEAFASADRLAIMVEGRIVQNDIPSVVYHRPASPAVARLTGEAIFLDAEIRNGLALTALGPLSPHQGSPLPGREAVAMLRPEQIVQTGPGQGIPARILAGHFRGDHTLVTAGLNGRTLDFRASGWKAAIAGDDIRLGVTGPCVVFPPERTSSGAG